MSALLEVEDLRVTFPTRTGLIEAVRGVSFALGRERLGIVGESGSGKSQTGRAIMGLTPPQARISARKLAFDGIDLLGISARQRRALRGNRIAMILQDPKYSLDPVMSIGRQIVETLRTHEKVSKAEARERALAMLEAVQIRDPKRVFDLHPHEVSGGMGHPPEVLDRLHNFAGLIDVGLAQRNRPVDSFGHHVPRCQDRGQQEQEFGVFVHWPNWPHLQEIHFPRRRHVHGGIGFSAAHSPRRAFLASASSGASSFRAFPFAYRGSTQA